jgi:hypothetical protein
VQEYQYFGRCRLVAEYLFAVTSQISWKSSQRCSPMCPVSQTHSSKSVLAHGMLTKSSSYHALHNRAFDFHLDLGRPLDARTPRLPNNISSSLTRMDFRYTQEHMEFRLACFRFSPCSAQARLGFAGLKNIDFVDIANITTYCKANRDRNTCQLSRSSHNAMNVSQFSRLHHLLPATSTLFRNRYS